MSVLRVEQFTDPLRFVDRAWRFLELAEIENNLVYGLALAAVRPAPGAIPLSYLAAVLDADAVVMCALVSLPGRLVVTSALRPDACAAVVADAHRTCRRLQSLTGPEPAAASCASLLADAVGGPARVRMKQQFHSLERVTFPDTPAPGGLRRPYVSERDLVVTWVEAFFAEHDERVDALALTTQKLAEGCLFLWDNGGPVSMVGWAGKTPNAVRLNMVYTPPSERGRRYATTAVATLTERLLREGNRACCLATDLDNRTTSNQIYARLGYRFVCDAGLYELTRPTDLPPSPGSS